MQSAPGSTLKLLVSNNGTTREVDLPSSSNPYQRTFGYSPIPAIIGEVAIGTPADRAGLRDGDLVRAIDGQKIQYWDQFVDLVRNSGGKTLQLDVERKGKDLNLSVTPQKGLSEGAENAYQVGMLPEFAVSYQHVGPFQALKASSLQTASLVTQTVDVVGRAFGFQRLRQAAPKRGRHLPHRRTSRRPRRLTPSSVSWPSSASISASSIFFPSPSSMVATSSFSLSKDFAAEISASPSKSASSRLVWSFS